MTCEETTGRTQTEKGITNRKEIESKKEDHVERRVNAN